MAEDVNGNPIPQHIIDEWLKLVDDGATQSLKFLWELKKLLEKYNACIMYTGGGDGDWGVPPNCMIFDVGSERALTLPQAWFEASDISCE